MRTLSAVLAAAAVLTLTPEAKAHSVGDELSVSTTTTDDSTGAKQRTFSNTLTGNIELVEDRFGVDLLVSTLRDEGTTLRHFLSASGEYTPDEHWTFDAGLSGTLPYRGQEPVSSSVVNACKAEGDARAKLQAACANPKTAPKAFLATNDSTLGFMLVGSYDTAGDSNFETSFDLLVGATHYSLDQVAKVRVGAQVVDLCGNGRCKNASGAEFADSLNQLRIAAGATGTLYETTDVGLRLTFYGYDGDPTSAGQHFTRLGQVVGAGIPVAPLSWEVRPTVGHRFGRMVAASLSYTRGSYAGDIGNENVVTAKVSFKPVRAFRTWLSMSVQRDTPPSGVEAEVSKANYVSVGAEYRF